PGGWARASAPGDPAVAALVEAPGLRDPGLAREVDADPGPLHDVRVADRQTAVLEVEGGAGEVGAVEGAIDGEGLAEQARAVGTLGEALQRLEGAEQDGGGVAG